MFSTDKRQAEDVGEGSTPGGSPTVLLGYSPTPCFDTSSVFLIMDGNFYVVYLVFLSLLDKVTPEMNGWVGKQTAAFPGYGPFISLFMELL